MYSNMSQARSIGRLLPKNKGFLKSLKSRGGMEWPMKVSKSYCWMLNYEILLYQTEWLRNSSLRLETDSSVFTFFFFLFLSLVNSYLAGREWF